MRRPFAWTVLFALVIPLAAVAEAAPGPLRPAATLGATPLVGVTKPIFTVGRVTLEGFGVPDADVQILVDGVVAAVGFTDLTGRYNISFSAPATPGVRSLVAHASLRTVFAVDSAPVHVNVVEPPGAPSSLALDFDGIHSRATLTWSPPATNGGASLTRYHLERGVGTGAWGTIAILSPSVLSFADESVQWGKYYEYRVRAQNVAGLGAPSAVVSVTLPPATPSVLTFSIPYVLICSDGGAYCATYVAGTTVTTQGPSSSFRPIVQGQLTTQGGDGVGPVSLRFHMETSFGGSTTVRQNWATTTTAGHYSTSIDPSVWFYDQAIGECRDIAFLGSVEYASLVTPATQTVRVCRGS